MREYIAVVALMLISSPVGAKCLDGFYTVKGRVITEDGMPSPNAIVGVAWVERGLAAGPAVATTDRNGFYTLYFRFHKFTGIGPRGDECGGKLQEIRIAAFTPTNQSVSFSIPVTKGDKIPITPHPIPLSLKREGP
jgi:hypothetical protein